MPFVLFRHISGVVESLDRTTDREGHKAGTEYIGKHDNPLWRPVAFMKPA